MEQYIKGFKGFTPVKMCGLSPLASCYLLCWIYLRHVSTLHEPCRGCAMMESIGWEFWTPGRGRSAWWRHPCWMFIQLDSHWIIQRVMIFKSWSIPHKLCIVNYQGWSSLLHLFKPNRYFFPKNPLDPRPFRLHPRLDFNRTFLCTVIQGRDTTRALHKSRL